MRNQMKMEIAALSMNEGLARVAVASFMSCLNPTLEDVEDVKTAVSEAVTNCIIHGYGPEQGKVNEDESHWKEKMVYITCEIEGRELKIEIRDKGIGIEDVAKAMEPLFTTKPELERSGMGFAFMEAFMDELLVESEPHKGTVVTMKKVIPYLTYSNKEI